MTLIHIIFQMIMDRIRKNVLDKVKEGPVFLKLLFHFAYNYKLLHLKHGFDTPILNRFVNLVLIFEDYLPSSERHTYTLNVNNILRA